LVSFKPTLLSQNIDADAKNASQLSTPILSGIIIFCVICAIAVISAGVYYWRLKADYASQPQLRDWINANQDTVNVTVFDSPKYRQSVLEPRNSRPIKTQSLPRFSMFNQNPFAISFRSIIPRTEGETSVNLDEHYKTQGQGLVVPDTINPSALSNRQNSVRIHLPINRDTEAFEFEM